MTEQRTTDLSPSEISHHRFATSFRGYDPTEVRVFLQQVSHRLAQAADRETELRRRIDELETELEAEPAASGDEDAGSAHEHGDGGGLDAARAEAAEVLAAARAEAAQLVAQAHDEAAKLVLRARVEARGATPVPLAPPADDVPANADDARDQAKAMIAEAREFRERVLTDLAKRRRVAHVQLEQLRAAKEKLLESLREARRMVDDTARDLSTADVEARVAADLAGRRVAMEPLPTARAIEAELQTARQFAIPISSARALRPEPADQPADQPADSQADSQADEAAATLVEGDAPDEEDAPIDDRPADDAVPTDDGGPADDAVPTDDGGIWAGEFAPTPRVRDESAMLPMRERLRRAAEAEVEAGRAAPVPSREAHDGAGGDGPDGEEASGRTARIEDLFARLRAEREAAAATARAVLAEEPGTTGPAAEPAAEPGASPLSPDDEALLRRRDLALELVDARLTRALRRTLQDEHSGVLAALRTARGRVAAAGLLPSLDDHRSAYAALLVPALAEAAQAGSVMGTAIGGGRPAPDADEIGAAHGARLAATLTASLRAKVDAAVGSVGSAEADSAQLVDAISGAYREWRSERVARFVGDALAASFAEGLHGTVADGAAVYWILDDGAEPCSECDDNVLAGPVAKGTAFPTGHHAPPAHGGCRCLVVPAPAG